MPFVERRNGIVVGVYANLQPGYAEEQVADDDAEVVAFRNPSPADAPLALEQVACVHLTIDGWDVTGLERSSGLSLAFVADTDTVWVFFDDPQPDTDYIIMPADGVTKETDHVEVTREGLAEVALLVFRVQ